MSALDEAEIDGLAVGVLDKFLGRRGSLWLCLRRERVEARGHGLPGARWATHREVGFAPEVVIEVWRYGEEHGFGSVHEIGTVAKRYDAWREHALRVLRACLRGTPAAGEFAEAVLAAVKLGGDPAVLEREARTILRRRGKP
jgi:hypothetical protein